MRSKSMFLNVLYNIKCLLAVFFLCFGSIACAAPDLELYGTDGKKYNLNKFIGHGKWTVLNIWGTDCPPCQEEIPELVNFHDNHQDKDAIVLGVAIDFPSYGYADKEEVIQFMDDHLMDFTVLLSDDSVTQKIDAGSLQGLPTTLVYKPDGELAGMQVGTVTAKILETFIAKHSKQKKMNK